VISVVEIREFNLGSSRDWEKRWNERQIFLRDLFRRQRSWFRESTLQINYREGRLRGKYAAFGDDLVAFCLDWSRMRFRKFYAPFDDSARQKRNGHDGKYCVKPQ
jgi:hypothetical protein